MPSFSAILRALALGRTWKPMMMALEAAARSTSLSEIAPTARWITFTFTSSVESLMRESVRASIEPSTSALSTMLSSLKLPMAIRRPISSRVMCWVVLMPWMRMSCSRLLAMSLASFSSSSTLKLSPAVGAPFRPSTDTGVDGPAASIFCPLSLNMAFTLPV